LTRPTTTTGRPPFDRLAEIKPAVHKRQRQRVESGKEIAEETRRPTETWPPVGTPRTLSTLSSPLSFASSSLLGRDD